MTFKMAAGEDFEIVTKDGGAVTVPSGAADKTLATTTDVPDYVMQIDPQTGGIFYTTP